MISVFDSQLMIGVSSLKPYYRQAWTQSIFWLAYFLFEWLNTGAYSDNFQRSFCFISINIPILILAGYWHLIVTVRHFLLKNRLAGFLISLLGGLLLFGLMRRAVNYYLFYPAYHPEGLNKVLIYWPKIFAESIQLHLVVALFVTVDLVRHMLKQQQENETYRREKMSAEYRLLQSQVQPHFLFNTLNNLISVSLHQPAQMPNLLHRLAGLLNYQLHESHRDSVPLVKEIEYINDYISLEQIRYGDRLDVQTNFDSLASLSRLVIPPMLLLPFVENAFKHGAAQTEGNCWIQMHLSVHNNLLVFSVENSVAQDIQPAFSSGLGLGNLRKRMEFLFPEGHELVTLAENGQFLAVLKFNLV